MTDWQALLLQGFAAGQAIGFGIWCAVMLFRQGRASISAFGVGRGWPE